MHFFPQKVYLYSRRPQNSKAIGRVESRRWIFQPVLFQLWFFSYSCSYFKHL